MFHTIKFDGGKKLQARCLNLVTKMPDMSLESIIELYPTNNHADWFNKIANELMKNYCIEAAGVKYRFLEIEFYYHSADHPDTTAYGYSKTPDKDPRIARLKACQKQPLTWFFHYSGIDFVFGNGDNPGGILIRSIERLADKDKKVEKLAIVGPLVTQMVLLNQHLDVNGNKSLSLKLAREPYPFKLAIETTRRCGINSGKYASRKYNFYDKKYYRELKIESRKFNDMDEGNSTE